MKPLKPQELVPLKFIPMSLFFLSVLHPDELPQGEPPPPESPPSEPPPPEPPPSSFGPLVASILLVTASSYGSRCFWTKFLAAFANKSALTERCTLINNVTISRSLGWLRSLLPSDLFFNPKNSYYGNKSITALIFCGATKRCHDHAIYQQRIFPSTDVNLLPLPSSNGIISTTNQSICIRLRIVSLLILSLLI